MCLFSFVKLFCDLYIRESVDSLCRDGADAQYMQQDLKNIKNVKGCRDGMPKSMQTR